MNHRRVGAEELRVQHRIVEGVIVVREHLARVDPGASRTRGFGQPDLAEEGRLTGLLREDREPLAAPGVPGDVAAVDRDGFAGRRRGGGRSLHRSPFFRILPVFVGRRRAERRERVAEKDPLAADGVCPRHRVAVRDWRRGRMGGVFGPHRVERMEDFFVRIPLDEVPAVSVHLAFHFHRRGDEVRRALGVGQRDRTPDPGRAFAGHLRHPAWTQFALRGLALAHVGVGRPQRRLRRRREFIRRRRGDIEDAQRVVGQIRVAPEPEQLPAEFGCHHAVGTEDTAFFPIQLLAELLGFCEEAGAGETAEATGEDRAFHRDLECLPWGGREADA